MSEKGHALLLRARQAFRDQRTAATLAKLDTADWGPIYYWPALSVEESIAVGRFLELKDGQVLLTYAASLEACLANVLYRARDEAGLRLFSDADEPALRDVDPEALQAVGAAMGFVRPTLEEAEKK